MVVNARTRIRVQPHLRPIFLREGIGAGAKFFGYARYERGGQDKGECQYEKYAYHVFYTSSLISVMMSMSDSKA